jgi:beta-N-acetylhexosaminidase
MLGIGSRRERCSQKEGHRRSREPPIDIHSVPATTSPTVIRDIIRKRISSDGLLVSDDVSMNALSGDYGDRVRAIREAGCDLVLHCNGRIEEMRAIADATPELAGTAGERAARALAVTRPAQPFDRNAGREELIRLVARAGWRPAA